MFAQTYGPKTQAYPMKNLYRQIGVETGVVDASPHRLISMLFDALNEAIAQAKGAMAQRRIADKGAAITRAVRIVEEGLKGGLDMTRGQPLASDLDALYGYVSMRLTMANLNNDLQALEECERLISPVQKAWNEIAPQSQS